MSGSYPFLKGGMAVPGGRLFESNILGNVFHWPGAGEPDNLTVYRPEAGRVGAA
jgi:hypothetical protein